MFLNHLSSQGCSDLHDLDPGTTLNALLPVANKDDYARIRQFLRYLSENSITDRDYSGIVPRYSRPQKLPNIYTPEEIGRIEEAIDINTDTGIRNLAIIRFATRMGLRSGDIARLRYSEIDLDSGYINLVQEKTGQPLVLKMPSEVSEALLMHLTNQKTNHYNDGYIFHSMSAPYGRITTSIIRHAVNDCFLHAGIDISGKKHGPHSFRSSLASSMVNDGASYEIVRRILGHSDPDVIKHYAKADIENLRLCSIEPPEPAGRFKEYLSGKKVICCV